MSVKELFIKYSFRLFLFLAVLLYLLIFLYIKIPVQQSNIYSNTRTSLLEGDESIFIKNNYDTRIIEAPILFGLPTKFGFGQKLFYIQDEVNLNFVSFSQKEKYLEYSYTRHSISNNWDDQLTDLYLLSSIQNNLNYLSDQKIINEIRYDMSSNLASRISGGVVFPSELNQNNNNKMWVILATIHISENGLVEHVFLEEPYSEDFQPHTIISMLHRLKFKNGSPAIGWIKLYSQTKL